MCDELEFTIKTKKLFARVASVYDSRLARWYLAPLHQKTIALVEKYGLPDDARMLDLACGTGEVLVRLAEKFPRVQFFGIDASSPMLARAREKTNGLRNVRYIEGSAAHLPFRDQEFEMVVSTEAFHHFGEPEKVLQEVYRILKFGGILILVDPGADTFLQKLIFRWIGPLCEVHKKIYTQQELKELLLQAKFHLDTVWQYRMNNFFLARK